MQMPTIEYRSYLILKAMAFCLKPWFKCAPLSTDGVIWIWVIGSILVPNSISNPSINDICSSPHMYVTTQLRFTTLRPITCGPTFRLPGIPIIHISYGTTFFLYGTTLSMCQVGHADKMLWRPACLDCYNIYCQWGLRKISKFMDIALLKWINDYCGR